MRLLFVNAEWKCPYDIHIDMLIISMNIFVWPEMCQESPSVSYVSIHSNVLIRCECTFFGSRFSRDVSEISETKSNIIILIPSKMCIFIFVEWISICKPSLIKSSIKPECNYLEMNKLNGNINFGLCSMTTTGKKTDVILKRKIIHKHILLLHADLFKHSKYSHLKVKFRSLELNHIKSRYQWQHIKTIRIKNNTYMNMNMCARVCCVYNNSVLYGFHQFTRCHDPFMSLNKMLSILSIPNANANGTNEWVSDSSNQKHRQKITHIEIILFLCKIHSIQNMFAFSC